MKSIIITTGFALLVAGCMGDVQNKTEVAKVGDAAPMDSEELPTHMPDPHQEISRLPDIVTSELCGAPPTRLHECTWMKGADLFFWGEVLSIEPVYSPSLLAVGGTELVTECPGTLQPSIAVEVELHFTSSTELEGESFTFYIGTQQIGSWSAYAYLENDVLRWGSWGDGDGAGIAPGMVVGAPLYWSDEFEVWTLLAEPLFELREDGVRIQAVQERCVLYPELDGLSANELQDLFEGCDRTEEALQRRQFMNEFLQQPALVMASVCFTPDNHDDDRCYSSGSCELGQVCVDNECVVGECTGDEYCTGYRRCVDLYCVPTGE